MFVYSRTHQGALRLQPRLTRSLYVVTRFVDILFVWFDSSSSVFAQSAVSCFGADKHHRVTEEEKMEAG